MKKMHLQKLTLTAITLFLMGSCSKDNASSDTSVDTPAALPSVIIGSQVWTTNNLDVTTYRDGTPIPQVSDGATWSTLRTGAWCYYENSGSNGTSYGKLYNWYAVAGIHDNDPNTPNKVLAPTGWHVPTDAEWTTLTTFLGGESVAGGKMKAYMYWSSPNKDATNSSGFTGFPGGHRTSSTTGFFQDIRYSGFWWNVSGGCFKLSYYDGNAYRVGAGQAAGNSVRCVMD